MFGLGFQELLIILLLLVLFPVVLPTVTYLIASLFLKGWIVATPVAPRVVAARRRLRRTYLCKRSGPEPLYRDRDPRSSADCAQRRMALVGGLLLVASESVSRRCSMAEHGCTPVPCSTSCRSPVIVASSVTRKGQP